MLNKLDPWYFINYFREIFKNEEFDYKIFVLIDADFKNFKITYEQFGCSKIFLPFKRTLHGIPNHFCAKLNHIPLNNRGLFILNNGGPKILRGKWNNLSRTKFEFFERIQKKISSVLSLDSDQHYILTQSTAVGYWEFEKNMIGWIFHG
jgi:hypothetical protein